MKTAELLESEPVEAPAENLRVKLPLGLLGFERTKDFELVSHADYHPFFWLRFMDDPELAFPVVSPFVVNARYQPDISPEDERFLGLETPTDALVLCVVTVRSGDSSTVNLRGPIVINRHTLVGRQIVPVNASQFSLQHPLPVSR